MKNLFAYYFAILLPVPAIVWLALQPSRAVLFIVALAVYLFIYRTLTDFYRLEQKGVVKKGDLWRMLIPLWRLKYFHELYFQR